MCTCTKFWLPCVRAHSDIHRSIHTRLTLKWNKVTIEWISYEASIWCWIFRNMGVLHSEGCWDRDNCSFFFIGGGGKILLCNTCGPETHNPVSLPKCWDSRLVPSGCGPVGGKNLPCLHPPAYLAKSTFLEDLGYTYSAKVSKSLLFYVLFYFFKRVWLQVRIPP